MNVKKLGSQNNHKYFPEFIIKSFYGKKPVSFLNAKNGKVIQGPYSKDYNTATGWYSDDNEVAMNKDAEQQFQQISVVINKMARSGKRDFSQLEFDPEIVYRFFAYQILRDPANSSAILDKLIAQGGIKSKREEISLQDFQNCTISMEQTKHIVKEALRELFAIVLEPNYTDIDYIAVNTPVEIRFSDGKMYVLVTAPKLAVCLVARELFDALKLGVIRDDGLDCINTTNERIMAHAIVHKPHEVLGRNSQQLKELWSNTKKKIV